MVKERPEDLHLRCNRCGTIDPNHITLDGEGKLFGCSSCPDYHKWFCDWCESCGKSAFDVGHNNICEGRKL
jgi:ribosomal protein L37E